MSEENTLTQREIDMLSLDITEDDIVNNKAKVIEKLFCAALCKQDTSIINSVLNDFIDIRDRFYFKNKNPNCPYWDEGEHVWDDNGRCACGAALKLK